MPYSEVAVPVARQPIALKLSPISINWRGLSPSSGIIPHCTSSADPAPIISTSPVASIASSGATPSRSMIRNPITCPAIACACPRTRPQIIQARTRGSRNPIGSILSAVAAVTLAPLACPPIDG